eukprot:15446018-Alexandrium_andersonii.AAC.1
MSYAPPDAAAFSGSAAAVDGGRTPGAGDLPSGPPPPVLPASSAPADGGGKLRSRKGRRSRGRGGGDGR